MPLEGQWQRQRTPLSRLAARERGLLVAAGVLAVAGLAVTVVLLLSSSSARLAPGCVQFTTPSATGAAIVHSCGSDAARLCTQQRGRSDSLAETVREPCRRAGYP